MSRRPHAAPPSFGAQGRRSGGHQGLWLWGTHPVLAALANPERICRRLVLSPETLQQHGAVVTQALANRGGLAPETLDRTAFEALLPAGAVHQGFALQAEPLPGAAIEDLVDQAEGCSQAVVVVLDQVTDPHNVGAILRSAAAFGALGLVMPDRHAPPETGTLAKSASGALERVPLVRVTNLVRALAALKAGGFWIAGLDGEATTTLAATGLSGKIALVLGAEGEGLRRLTREACDYLVKLPQTDLVESLNVSNAAAVALYELVRR